MDQNDSIQHYRAEFDRLRGQLPGPGTARTKAFEQFAARGFPGTREEAWKYTDLRALSRQTPRAEPATADAVPESAGPRDWNAIRFTLVNGELSIPAGLPAGITALPLAEALDTRPELAETLQDERHPLRALNAAFVSAGLYLEIADGACCEQPLHLLCAAADDSGGMQNLRHVIRLGAGARCTLVEHYAGSDEARHFLNAVTDIRLSERAQLHRVLLQEDASAAWHIHATEIDQSRGSIARLFNIDLGARLARADTEVFLNEPESEIHLHGLYFPDGRRHVDNHTLIEHRAPSCTSRETYHGILDGHGRGVFNGRIVVHQDAQKTDSEQSSRAILLSRNAEVDAKPELEIYADDVKCAHGATVGQLDEEALFYLESRGIDHETARALLVYSFADEVISAIEDETLRRHVESLVMARLPGGLAADEVLA